jgi:hypothetical protein
VLEWVEKTNPSWLTHVIVFTAASSRVIAGLEQEHRICRILRKPFDITDLVNGIASCAAVAVTEQGRSPENETQARQ